MTVVLTILGAVLILTGLNDMFHSLLHPRGSGVISHAILRGIWRVSRSLGHRFGSGAGPAAMVAVTVLWVILQVVGWALIYLPHVPAGFSYGPGVDPARYPEAMQALYISAVTLSTLGFGDVVATQPAIRLLAPAQALTGFALLTAALSWFTQSFPPLSRRRALALDIACLADADYASALADLDTATISRELSTLSSDVDKCVVDLVQHSESYYFLETQPSTSLARQLPYLMELRDRSAEFSSPDVRVASRRLESALDELATELDNQFLGSGGPPEEVFHAYARDHKRTGSH